MSRLSDIKHFLKKYFKNPVVAVAVAYLIYRIMTKKLKKESLMESIKVISTNNNYEIIFDDTINKYILIDTKTHDVFQAETEGEIKAFATKQYGDD